MDGSLDLSVVEGLQRTPGVIRIALVVGVRLYREGLATELNRDPRLSVVGQTGTTLDGVALVMRTTPDVVLVDIRSPNAFRLLRALRDDPSPVPAVAFAVDESEEDIERCAEAGVTGFITQEVTIAGVASALIAACHGELDCSPRSAAMLFRRLSERLSASVSRGTANALDHLTAREREILACVAVGHSNKRIAGELSIQTTTVKNHVHHILEKLGARTRVEAVARLRGVERMVQNS